MLGNSKMGTTSYTLEWTLAGLTTFLGGTGPPPFHSTFGGS